jgi:hypothetical protein
MMCAVDDDQRFTELLTAMRSIWIDASGGSHAHLDALLDPETRHDARTTNYLASGASGTLRDRIFSPSNGDRVSDGNSSVVNARYRQLVDEATLESVRLGLPATADWSQPRA